MAVKTFLSVSLLFWLLISYLDCGLQDAKASPESNIFAKQLDSLKSHYSEKTSDIQERTSGDQHQNPQGIAYTQERYDGRLISIYAPVNFSLSAVYCDGWLVDDIKASTIWYGEEGALWLSSGGPGEDNWNLTWSTGPPVGEVKYNVTVKLIKQVYKNFLLFYEYFKSELSSSHRGISLCLRFLLPLPIIKIYFLPICQEKYLPCNGNTILAS
jgi:hypothetical protein